VALEPTIEYWDGEPGVGKTFTLVYLLVKKFLTEKPGMVHLSNLPIRAEAVAEHWGASDPAKVENARSRIERIDRDAWRMMVEGDLFLGDYLDHVQAQDDRPRYVVIDECHEIAGKRMKTKDADRWEQMLGSFRHRGGWVIAFCTQDASKVHPVIKAHAGRQVQLSDRARERGAFGILHGDYDQFFSKWTGQNLQICRLTESTRRDGRMQRTWTTDVVLREPFFSLYDTHNPIEGAAAQSARQPEPWERLSWPGLCWWFVVRNGMKPARAYAALGGMAAIWGGVQFLPLVQQLLFKVPVPAPKPAVAPLDRQPSAAKPGESKVPLDRQPSSAKPPGESKGPERPTGEVRVFGVVGQTILTSEGPKQIGESFDGNTTIAGVDPGRVLLADGRRLSFTNRPTVAQSRLSPGAAATVPAEQPIASASAAVHDPSAPSTAGRGAQRAFK
jgi:hypothetical protein